MQQLSILVVDDDQEVCEYLEAVFVQDGHHVCCVQDPTLAITEIKKEAHHVILLDLLMPKLSGIELLTKVRHLDSDIAVIMLTGYPTVESVTESISLEVSAYLSKPVSAIELRETLRRVARTKGLVHGQEEHLHQTIGRTIRRLRKARNRTLAKIAKRSGMSVSLLSQIERAECSASMSTMLKIATALEVKVSVLFGDF